jgi:predicted alpha/beta-fold hydrolase
MTELRIEPCLPPLWARGGHAQTILAHIFPSRMLDKKGRRIEIGLEDGDKLVGFVHPGTSNIVLYLFHGLAGSTDSGYMHRTARIALALGHTVIMANHRGCGEGAGLARGPYHSGRAEDLSAVIGFGRKNFPKHRHLAVGFSLSGNALLLLLAGQRGEEKPDLAISVNAPIHLESVAYALKKGLNRLYDIDFVRRCRRDVRRARPGEIQFPLWNTLHDFDTIYTAPAGGFKNREEYYETCSTWELLSKIKTPTLIMTTKDDPFVSFEHYRLAKLSPHVQLHVEEFGGHMGYLTAAKTPLGSRRWLDYALHEGIQALTR